MFNPAPIIEPRSIEPLFMDIRGVAKALAVSSKTVERLIATGEFPPGRKIGRLRRWTRHEVEQWARTPAPETTPTK